MSSYNPAVPTGTVNLDQDYANIQANFGQANTSFGIDHVAFDVNTSDNPAGYHKSAHFVPVSTTATNPPNNQPVITPLATTGFGQLFSSQINDGINIDEALYFLTGGNRLTQLTRNFQPSISTNGYTFLPGGLILQYGISLSNTSSPNGTVVFPIAFPNTSFGVQICVLEASNSRRIWHINALSTTGFTAYIQDSNGSSVANNFYWVALGN